MGLNRVDSSHYRDADGAPWAGELAACEFDAEYMAEVAVKAGFEAAILRSPEASSDALLKGVESAADRLGPGDIFLLSYSGHGGQLPNENGDDEPDLMDETLCLYDRQVIDDELWGVWARFRPGVRILAVFDSCHSGTAVKAPLGAAEATVSPYETESARPRAMSPLACGYTYRANSALYDSLAGRPSRGERGDVAASVLLLSGCQDNQLSLDGTFNGLFTGTLRQVWGPEGFRGSYRQFHEAILARMPYYQSPNYFLAGAPNPGFEAQRPFTI